MEVEFSLKSVVETDTHTIWTYSDGRNEVWFTRSKPQMLWWSKLSDPEQWPKMEGAE